MKKEPKDEKPVRGGCIHCPGSQDLLPLDEVLYMGFGGYSVSKDGKHYYSGDPNGEWDSFKTLSEIEVAARKEPESDWRVRLDNPIRDAEWQRQGDDQWVLIKSGMGFA